MSLGSTSPVPATIDHSTAVEQVVDATTKHALLVSTAVMRYEAMTPAPLRVEGVLALPPTHAAMVRAEQGRGALLSAAIVLTSVGGLLGTVATADALNAMWPLLLGIPATLAGSCRLIAADVKNDQRKFLRKNSCARTLPGPVAQAYRRIQSAAIEMDDTSEHEAETVATARLSADGARDLALLIAEHHEAGTFHTAPAQALAGEMYRLAAEMDAYLTIHNADRFAPAEAEALALTSTTSQFAFTPTQNPTA